MLGLAYAAIIVISMPGAWAFYLFMGVIEALLWVLIAWQAWRWPRMASA
ncbi:hypothetical protein [Dyella sp. C9]|nr:hypothetical protein [Dyella sp. C9]